MAINRQVCLALGLEAGGWGALVERAAAHGAAGSECTGASSVARNSLMAHAGFASLANLARRCSVCLATFPSVWLLERHALLQHAGQSSDDKPFTCEQCGQRYRYRSAYVKHREQNHRARLPADKLFTCDVCGMQFRYLKSFKKHRLNHALERLQRGAEPRGVVTLAVAVSGSGNTSGAGSASSSASSSVERSDQVSSTGEPSQVDTLDNSTDANEQVERAEQVEEITLKEMCGSNERAEPTTASRIEDREIDVNSMADDDRPETNSATALTGSGPTHRELDNKRERRFACPFCGKCVRSKENLKLHVRKHTGERPFVCLFCGRAFGGKSDLTRHLRIHTGERPYHCEMCGKCFARADYLSKHLTTHIHQR